MEIIIKTKNLSLTDALEIQVNKKTAGLGKFFKGRDIKVYVEIEKVTKHHRKGDVFAAEIMAEKLVAKAHGEDLMKAVVQAREQMEREIRKHKAKIVELPRRKYRKVQEIEI